MLHALPDGNPTTPAHRVDRRAVTRAACAAIGALALLAGADRAAEAQGASDLKVGWEFLVPSGMLIPTGTQHDAIQRGGLTAAQVSYVVRPPMALTATIGWARSRDVASIGHPKLDVFTVDVGGEVRGPKWFADHRATLRPFAGIGAGVRSYNYRSLHVDATHNLSAYGSMGGELGIGRVRVRLEARDYITGFKPLDGRPGPTDTRNDIVVILGLRLVRR